VARLLAAFRSFYGADEPSDEAMLEAVRKLIGTPDAEYLLAGDPAAGIAQVRYRLSVWTGADDCWVEDVFVEEHARGNGLGRRLIEGCVERARQRGCRRVQLDANENNGGALALYRSLGFESGSPARWDGARDLYFTLWL
jgi:ribosomal protein S18 acetylase RimI-like enzyme